MFSLLSGDPRPIKGRFLTADGARTMETTAPTFSLADLRAEIDRIDAAMHGLLMERGEIIDRLIRVKHTAESGSAFRPAREADMMRRLVERHHGILPLDTAEGIWRVIIATFTYVQAPFRVHADMSAGDAAMRDSARFHFGFTVPFMTHMGASGVVAAVAKSQGDLGLVPATAIPGAGTWWTALEGNAPKIIARLPFLERADHPAGLPVFAIARPHPDAIVTDVEMWSIKVSGWGPRPAQSLAAVAEAIAVPDTAFDGAALLVSVPREQKLGDAINALVRAGASVRSQTLVGSHARRYTVTPDGAVSAGH
jgi:chorismate mutase